MDVTKIITKQINFAEFILDNYGIELDRDRCACPIHSGANKTSFMIKDDRAYCFSCGFYGSVIDFVAQYDGIDYHSAVDKLADYLNIDLTGKGYEVYQKKKSIIEKNIALAKQKQKQIDKYKDYLTKTRGLSEATIDSFQLGGEKSGIIIPLRNCSGQCVAFAQRNTNFGAEGKPKYINSKNNEVYEKGEFLYNLDMALPLLRTQGKVYMCEGYFDVMSAHEQGTACVGYGSSDITIGQIKLLGNKVKDLLPMFTIIVAPDNDDAGQQKIPRFRDKFAIHIPKATVRVAIFPDDVKDFNDCHVKGIKINELPTEPIDIFVLKQKMNKCKSKDEQYNVARDFVNTVTNLVVKDECIKFLADLWESGTGSIIKLLEAEDKTEKYQSAFKTAEEAVDELFEMYSSGQLTSGWESIDRSADGFYKKEVKFLAARPGIAKTFLACAESLHLAIREKKCGIYFSLEMSAGALYSRLIAMFLGISIREVKKRVLNRDLTVLKIQEVLEKRLYIVDDNSLMGSVKDINGLIEFANQRKFEAPCDFIVIDYIQYIKGSAKYEVFAEEVKQLKELAKKNNIFVIALCQISREGKEWERPTLNTLKGAGELEQTGDTVIAAFKPGLNPELSLSEQERLDGIITLSFLKHRRGFTQRDINVIIDKKTTRIGEV